jgi:hypothetical protein
MTQQELFDLIVKHLDPSEAHALAEKLRYWWWTHALEKPKHE